MKMKKIRAFLTILTFCFINNAYCAGFSKTTSGMKTIQLEIHAIVGVIFIITGLIVGTLMWRGTKTWEDCSKWVSGVAFAGVVVEIINIFYG